MVHSLSEKAWLHQVCCEACEMAQITNTACCHAKLLRPTLMPLSGAMN
jgi:hypothetical protein